VSQSPEALQAGSGTRLATDRQHPPLCTCEECMPAPAVSRRAVR
jgi:hypothetical protein